MEQTVVKTVVRFLGEWLEEEPDVQYEAFGADVELRIGRHRFLVKHVERCDAPSIRRAIRTLREGGDEDHVPVVSVPFMGTVGRRICAREHVSWIDLSGNTDIRADQIRILILGKADRSRKDTAAHNVFAPKSSRVVRFLLQHPFIPVRQIDVSRHVGLSRSFISRIVRSIVEQEFIRKLADGSIVCDRPELMLDAWDDRYEFFSEHRIARTATRDRSRKSPEGAVVRLLESERIRYAFSGWRAVSETPGDSHGLPLVVYVERMPTDELLLAGGWSRVQADEDVQWVVPGDEGVFQGTGQSADRAVVHPVQAYLDMSADAELFSQTRQKIREHICTRTA